MDAEPHEVMDVPVNMWLAGLFECGVDEKLHLTLRQIQDIRHQAPRRMKDVNESTKNSLGWRASTLTRVCGVDAHAQRTPPRGGSTLAGRVLL